MRLPRVYRRLAPIGIFVLAAAAVVGDEPAAWRLKVDPRVLDAVRRGPVEFVVILEDQADLGFASATTSRAERGRAVVDALRDTARRSQAPLIRLLESLEAEYRSYWIANMIWVRGDEEALRRVAEPAEVRRIDGNPRVAFELPRPSSPAGGVETAGATEWGLLKVLAPQVWAMGHDGDGIVIGAQDTGYDWDHPALIGAYRGWDGSTFDHDYNWHDSVHSGGGGCGPDSPEPCDDHGHGTHTMGTMVGDDGGGNQIGMSPGSRWIGCRNMDQGNGTPISYSECFQWFMAPTELDGGNPDPAKAPHVINNSWTCPEFEGCSPDTLKTVVENTRAAGIVVIASAGNSGSDCSSIISPPAIYDAALTIGATDSGDGLAGFSSRGPVTVDGSERRKPDVSAPGVDVRSSVRGGGYGNSSGTSMAAPHVTGLTGLLLSARPDLIGDVDAIETLIESAADPIFTGQECGAIPSTEFPNNACGFGRINALETLLGDADDDGTDNLDDCDPTDPAAWFEPSAVGGLALVDGVLGTTLSWSSPVEPGSSFWHYDVLRSIDPGDFGSAICVRQFLSVTQTSDPGDDPVEGFYYLIRVRNACAANLGQDSEGSARDGASCLAGGI